MNRGKILGVITAVGLVGLVVWKWTLPLPQPKNDIVLSEYTGQITTSMDTYRVRITETWDSFISGYIRHIELQPVDKPSSVFISGWDNEADGDWERISYCGYHLEGKSGCSGVVRSNSSWEFDPCPADDGKLAGFSQREIMDAEVELGLAMREIYDEHHMTNKVLRTAVEK